MKLEKWLRRGMEKIEGMKRLQRFLKEGFTLWQPGERVEMQDGRVYVVQNNGSWRKTVQEYR